MFIYFTAFSSDSHYDTIPQQNKRNHKHTIIPFNAIHHTKGRNMLKNFGNHMEIHSHDCGIWTFPNWCSEINTDNSVHGTGNGHRFALVRGRNPDCSFTAAADAAVLSSRFPPGQRHAPPSRRPPRSRRRHQLDQRSWQATNSSRISTRIENWTEKTINPLTEAQKLQLFQSSQTWIVKASGVIAAYQWRLNEQKWFIAWILGG